MTGYRTEREELRIRHREMDRVRRGKKILKATGYKNHTQELKNRDREPDRRKLVG